RFALPPEGRAVLADESSPACGVGFFAHLPGMMGIVERLPEACRGGIGLPYDAFGAEGAGAIERGFAPCFRTMLVPFALPQVPGLVERLGQGAQVADVGCGAGVAVLEMAKAFPRSAFHGWDVSEHALARAEENRRAAGAPNVTFHDARREPLPADAGFALVTTFDCLHDMTDPAATMRHIRAAIRPDGVWLVCDIKARESYEENVEKNPMAAMMRFVDGVEAGALPFAPPFVKVGDVIVSQTANILAFLAPRLGLVPDDEALRAEASQIQLTLADFVGEIHDTHHPIDGSLYYEDQKKEAKRRARAFVKERMPKYLGWLEDVLARNRKSEGRWLVGRDRTYVDLSAFQVVEGLRYAFPNA